MVEPFVINDYDLDGTRVIKVAGEIDAATAPQLAESLERCSGMSVCVDLAEVTFIDSSGLAVLSRAHKRADETGGEFSVKNPAANVRKAFEITRLDHLLTLEQN